MTIAELGKVYTVDLRGIFDKAPIRIEIVVTSEEEIVEKGKC